MKLGPLCFILKCIFLYMFFIKLKHGSVIQDTEIMEVRVMVNTYSCYGYFLSSKIKRVIVEKTCTIRVRMEKKRKLLDLHLDQQADSGHVT